MIRQDATFDTPRLTGQQSCITLKSSSCDCHNLTHHTRHRISNNGRRRDLVIVKTVREDGGYK